MSTNHGPDVGVGNGPRARRSRWPRAAGLGRLGAAAALGVTALGWGALVVLGTGGHLPAAGADGPAPCTAGPPPDPYHGFCATYDGRNTFYGTYGPGFPTNLGWAFCAENAAEGGAYPDPSYGYVPSGAPAGADTAGLGPLGFALSQADADGWWSGEAGQFTADQMAVAGKLFVDQVLWAQAPGAMDPGVLAAFDALQQLDQEAQGITGTPTMTAGLVGGGDTFSGSTQVAVAVSFPGSGHGVPGLGVVLHAAGGTFNGPSPTGSATVGVTTDAQGQVVVPLYADGPPPVSVTVTLASAVGQPGLGFYAPAVAGVQDLAAVVSPTTLTASLALTDLAPPDGTLQVVKAVDDPAYYGPGGAVFDVVAPSGTVAASLTTGATGATAVSPPLDPGPYTVREVTAPPGYSLQPDQTATVVAGQTTVVPFTGAHADQVVPGSVLIAKEDGTTGARLDGATFDVRYDADDDGTFGDDLGTCTTEGPAATCTPAGNDGTGLLPGRYQITEVAAPPGYAVVPADATQTVVVAPGQDRTVVFYDEQGGLQIAKSGDDGSYVSVVGATFSVAGPAPSSAAAGTLVVGPAGTSNQLTDLTPGVYTVTETAPPPGYQAVAPLTVTVPATGTVTVVDVEDHVQPATVTLAKVNAESGAPVAGATFDVRYAPTAGGPFDQDLGTCTTGSDGQCVPPGNDGPASLLPGDYQVTEARAPAGYALAPDPVQVVDLAPGQAGTVRFADPPLVPASFQKVATGNVGPGPVDLAGATLAVAPAAGGPSVAGCTTDATGACSTAPVLVGGDRYCWTETAAPPGLATGSGGCFTATEGQAAQPITVSDPGRYVAVAARKVDAADPGVGVPGAVFDLYRRDGGEGPPAPAPPAGAATEPGQTWVARATSGPDGTATFPLQLPGYAYCAVEHQAPADYLVAAGEQCTAVLSGSTTVPPPVATVTVADPEAMITVTAHKFDSASPDTGIPGATYDLYVEGAAPPSGPPGPAPAGVVPEPGDTWYARGTTDAGGLLSFSVPAGYAWCFREVTAPVDYALDPALHCTGVLTTSSPPAATTVAVPETLARTVVVGHKFDALAPATVIPGATYELLVEGTPPPGTDPPRAPPGVPVPPGDRYWASGTSDRAGNLTFVVPAGRAWCLHELAAPAGYRPDPGYHCSAVLTTATSAAAATTALPEVPVGTPPLAFTGFGVVPVVLAGATLAGAGLVVLVVSRRRRPSRGRRGGRAAVAAVVVAGSLGTAAALTATRDAPARASAVAAAWWPALPADTGLPSDGGESDPLSCAGTGFCLYVGPVGSSGTADHAWIYDDGTITGPVVADPSAPAGKSTAVSCGAPGTCVLVDTGGNEVTYRDGAWGTPDAIDPGGDLDAVSCGSATWCVALDADGRLFEDAGGTWSPAGSLPGGPYAVGCGPSACLAGDDVGEAWSIRAGATPTPVPGAPPGLAQLSCPEDDWCMATGADGSTMYADRWDGSTWTATDLSAAGAVTTLVELSCTSPTFCMTVVPGYAVTAWDGTAWSAPSDPGAGQPFVFAACGAPTLCLALGEDEATASTGLYPFAPPVAPAATLGAAPPAATLAAGSSTATVTLTPAYRGFVGINGPDRWSATYAWTCTGAACTSPAGTLHPPAADGAGTFGATPSAGAAPATVPPFTAAWGPGTFAVTATLTDTSTGAVASAVATVEVTATASPCTPAVAAVSGGGQSAATGSPFAAPLVARVTCGGVGVSGATVVFTLPTTGAGGTFPAAAATADATTGTGGDATSPVVTAGADPGAWTATARQSGSPAAVSYALTNVAAPAAAAQPTLPGPLPPGVRPAAPAPAPAHRPLALTGLPLVPLLATAGVLVAGGAALVVPGRRRRRPRSAGGRER